MKHEYMHYAGNKNKIEAKVALQFAARYRFIDILDKLKLQCQIEYQKCDQQVLERA